MSEKIKITVVMGIEKPNGANGGTNTGNLTLTQESAMTLMPLLLKDHLMDGSFCGGRGDCGRCVVQFLEGAPLPTGLERSRLEPGELRQGYRLACVTRPKADCTIRMVETEEEEIPIVTEINLLSGNIDLTGRKNNLSENQKPAAMKSTIKGPDGEEKNGCYIIAVDLGTTTIAMQLRNADTGETADTYCERNPQQRYGADVLARIQASVDGQGEELRRLVCGVILRGLGQFGEYLRGRGILCMCIAGNTVMEHLLLGYDVASLGKAPFVPVETGLQKIAADRLLAGIGNLPENPQGMDGEGIFGFPVYIAPCISAFVGGDVVAGLYALGLLSGGRSEDRGQAVLFIDLGTNGEMAVTDGQRMIVTATAAGPAFEGDGTMIGTDRIALTARLLCRGILDETGLLEEPYFTEGVRIEDGKEAIESGNQNKNAHYIKQEDIRALQMAKAAVRAGVEILWERMGRPAIEKVFLAGGFGYYLDVEAAVSIGLLPAYMRGRVQAVGNTSLAGAYELGRDLCGNWPDAVSLEERTVLVESVNLAETEEFERLYLKYMGLEEN